MPSIPIPQQVPIQRSDWNNGFSPGGGMEGAVSAVGKPENAINNAQTYTNDLAQNNQRTAAAAGDITDMQQKQNNMQASMLAGLAKLPPDQYETAKANIIPIANRMNPSRQFDPNMDQQTAALIAGGGVSAETQATLANNLQRAQMLNYMKAQHVETDAGTGLKMIVDSINGTRRPITPLEDEVYNTTGSLPGNQEGGGQPQGNLTGMLFPAAPSQNAQQTFDNFKGKGGAVPVPVGGGAPLTGNELGGQGQQPVFGFPPNNYANNPAALKLEQKNAATFDATRANRDILADQAEQKLNELEPDLVGTKDASGNVTGGVQGGPGIWKKLGFAAEGLSPSGSTELNTATQADAETKDLANTLSQMQVQPGSRGTKIALQTLLASKPDPYNQTPDANQKLLTNARTAINQYRLETSFLDAYKDANPQHIIDDRAYNLFDAMQKQFPLMSVDKATGKPTFNPENVEAFKSAIPDALSNPQKYINAKTQAQDLMQKNSENTQIKGNSNAPQSSTIVKSQNGVPFMFLGGDPTDQKNYKPVSQQGGASGSF